MFSRKSTRLSAAANGASTDHRWQLRVLHTEEVNAQGTSRANADLDVVSFGEAAVADQGCGDADKGEKVVGESFVAAMEPAEAR